MANVKGAMDRLRSMRQKFEALLGAARRGSSRYETEFTTALQRLQEVTGFGSNPGNLRMLVYRPKQALAIPSLVVALHGCSQTAEEYDRGTGWSSLADRLGFVVVYPQQQHSNNPKNCFSWFLPGDTTRGHGEALSIQQMVEHAIRDYGVDRRRVFVTGLSAGGAMAAAMLATYPEVFAGGAIIAGLPYGCARTVQQALEAMFTDQHSSARALGDRIRMASTHSGPWPKISIWHGTVDPIVKPSNAEGSIRQWLNVHGLCTAPSYEEKVGAHVRRVWNDIEGSTLVEAFSISGMAHGVPLGLSLDGDNCGTAGPFFLEAGISSTTNIAKFWELYDGVPAGGYVPTFQAANIPGDAHGVLVANRIHPDTTFDTDSSRGNSVYDPRTAIAAAFKMAGLAVPTFPNNATGASQVDPAPIIEAAMKAAGLRSG